MQASLKRSSTASACAWRQGPARKISVTVVDTCKVDELAGKKAVYCRCWRSATFPLCNGAHVAHNKETGDNVGPLIIEKSS
ncbi:CDGSH iron sulfur domain-containing protein 1 [Monoraphidium neglectum]|uniref:CDGSH iron sulfur domain-containing protein 1 n=1 Tax=Monoraphidium neglectum TaxID=145388 RepID=A0A0D2KZA7_9CHLO|nr:CDGSH iron sulfur domain-containing protein 1 [Monoraphidium neglectum]KIZ00539.1 CDGSH iron sulfur domain-containing protein 1 [Monoraphidium neglectum]|eukprot:XP_013899558.1 CDGSH iron sulfur domain-containing protein 1 [Monoraphidium neglectum]